MVHFSGFVFLTTMINSVRSIGRYIYETYKLILLRLNNVSVIIVTLLSLSTNIII